MKLVLFAALFAALALATLAVPMVGLETSAKLRPPTDWSRVRASENSDMMKVQIAIKQSNLDRLEVCMLLNQ